MIYIVEIGYKKFAFDNHNTALSFAELAKTKSVEDEEVTITLKFEEELDK